MNYEKLFKSMKQIKFIVKQGFKNVLK